VGRNMGRYRRQQAPQQQQQLMPLPVWQAAAAAGADSW
jgi:hypothetical protein